MCKLYWSVYRISSFRVNKSANSLTDISNIKKTRRNEEEDMNCNLAVIKGDGIGPEIVTEAMRVLDAVGEKYGHTFSYTQILMGGASIDVHGEPLTEEALEIAKNSDAVLMGSIGGNTSTSPWYKLPAQLRP